MFSLVSRPFPASMPDPSTLQCAILKSWEGLEDEEGLATKLGRAWGRGGPGNEAGKGLGTRRAWHRSWEGLGDEEGLALKLGRAWGRGSVMLSHITIVEFLEILGQLREFNYSTPYNKYQ